MLRLLLLCTLSAASSCYVLSAAPRVAAVRRAIARELTVLMLDGELASASDVEVSKVYRDIDVEDAAIAIDALKDEEPVLEDEDPILEGVVQLSRDVTRAECSWLDDDLTAGAVFRVFLGATYGAVAPTAIAVTALHGKESPFFELPRDALKKVPEYVLKPY